MKLNLNLNLIKINIKHLNIFSSMQIKRIIFAYLFLKKVIN